MSESMSEARSRKGSERGSKQGRKKSKKKGVQKKNSLAIQQIPEENEFEQPELDQRVD
jgi:predicted transposase YdaD